MEGRDILLRDGDDPASVVYHYLVSDEHGDALVAVIKELAAHQIGCRAKRLFHRV